MFIHEPSLLQNITMTSQFLWFVLQWEDKIVAIHGSKSYKENQQTEKESH